MKSTISIRSTANPRRTTLAHLSDADELTVRPHESAASGAEGLPASTANPRRTVLEDAPGN
ncbi:hypothetical protein E0L36_12865 [Streptomyces sp. AJS327]|uniref:hypothetical protein n=1 Tax=Streptomyces sp. AJS327 TaxID=2545265 RepID=UPI0015DEDE2A|nr:hypothetical protein [Streptomyces sp. AJS327]MBA0051757.1 hypothetical protein [Streptomyces sp. AJS327]